MYRGRQRAQISSPLGGIGSGCIGLAGNGRLVDWEIFSRPNKNSVNGYSHFAIRDEADGEVLDARILQGDYPPPSTGEVGIGGGCTGFDFGPRPEALAGLPHFEHTQFTGAFPTAEIQMRDHFNTFRSFALNDESGTVICTWPKPGIQPVTPVPYAQEAMHGFEYAVGIQMIQAGLVREGMTVVKSVRDRYDGAKRNPWNEIECGSNYARSRASYALLNAFSGLTFDAVQAQIGCAPARMPKGGFRCFWSLGSGWGTVAIEPSGLTLELMGGGRWSWRGSGSRTALRGGSSRPS